ncbi:MAG: hypothetical protein ACRDTM_00850 [Micromonosporaceae bacterium]
MYGWIWRKLPFGVPGKLIGSLLLLGVAVWLLWFYVFPWAEPILPFDDVQVEGPGGPGGNDLQPTETGAPSEPPGSPPASGEPSPS